MGTSRGLTSWLPAEPKVQAKVNFWLHWGHTSIRKATSEMLLPHLHSQKTNSVATKAALDFLNARLGETGPFLAGTTTPTIADLWILPEVDQLEIVNIVDLSEYPKVVEWKAALTKALPKSYETVVKNLKE